MTQAHGMSERIQEPFVSGNAGGQTAVIGKAEVRLRYSADDIDRVMIVMGAQPGRPSGGQITLRLWG